MVGILMLVVDTHLNPIENCDSWCACNRTKTIKILIKWSLTDRTKRLLPTYSIGTRNSYHGSQEYNEQSLPIFSKIHFYLVCCWFVIAKIELSRSFKEEILLTYNYYFSRKFFYLKNQKAKLSDELCKTARDLSYGYRVNLGENELSTFNDARKGSDKKELFDNKKC